MSQRTPDLPDDGIRFPVTTTERMPRDAPERVAWRRDDEAWNAAKRVARAKEQPMSVVEVNAWFSEKQAEVAGTVLYRRADGSEIVLTQVSESPDHDTKWDDIRHVGKVLKNGYVRRLEWGTMGTRCWFRTRKEPPMFEESELAEERIGSTGAAVDALDAEAAARSGAAREPEDERDGERWDGQS